MNTSLIVRRLRLSGLVVGFLLFAFTTMQWLQHASSVEAVQNSALSHLARK